MCLSIVSAYALTWILSIRDEGPAATLEAQWEQRQREFVAETFVRGCVWREHFPETPPPGARVRR